MANPWPYSFIPHPWAGRVIHHGSLSCRAWRPSHALNVAAGGANKSVLALSVGLSAILGLPLSTPLAHRQETEAEEPIPDCPGKYASRELSQTSCLDVNWQTTMAVRSNYTLEHLSCSQKSGFHLHCDPGLSPDYLTWFFKQGQGAPMQGLSPKTDVKAAKDGRWQEREAHGGTGDAVKDQKEVEEYPHVLDGRYCRQPTAVASAFPS